MERAFRGGRVNLLPEYAVDPDYERQVREVLTRVGRAHIPNFLDAAAAKLLFDTLRGADWWLAFRDGESAIEANLKEFEALDVAKRADIVRQVNAQASTSFQYLFDKARISEKTEAGERPEGALADFFAALNSERVLKHFRAITAEPNVAYVDAIASRYRPGHFLTLHHDEHEGAERLYAYVINLTPSWRADWGGLLEFVSRDGHIAEAFTPTWNAFNIFHVPQAHAVSIVAPYARAGRYSITGWLRADKP